MDTSVSGKKKLSFDFTLFAKMNNHQLSDYYICYDDLADELIFKFIKPIHPTFYHYIDDKFSLIIDDDTLQVVGIALINFSMVFLPNLSIGDKWENVLRPEITRKYLRVMQNQPSKQNDRIYDNIMPQIKRYEEKCFA